MSSCGNEPFVLQVLGDSMEPEFMDGHVIVIDPDARAMDGSFVLAKLAGEYIFRQLALRDGHYFLVPLNAHYPTAEIPGLEDVLGVIVEGGGLRRRERKKYHHNYE